MLYICVHSQGVGEFKAFGEEDIDAAFDSITQLKFNQRLKLTGEVRPLGGDSLVLLGKKGPTRMHPSGSSS